jgi:hypothetical protein
MFLIRSVIANGSVDRVCVPVPFVLAHEPALTKLGMVVLQTVSMLSVVASLLLQTVCDSV